LSLFPLVVDLDGTLIRTDMLHESALRIFRDRPLDILKTPVWLSQGRAVLKQNLADRAMLNHESLPYNQELLAWLVQQRADGRVLILCTASDQTIALAISEHLGIFNEVIASNGTVNLAGEHKAAALVARFGEGGFDYAGNSPADIAVWRHCRRATVVNASSALTRSATVNFEVERVFSSPVAGFATWRKVIRVHQWMKNLLLFVPFLAAHQIANSRVVGR
jgi:hypothetical protein